MKELVMLSSPRAYKVGYARVSASIATRRSRWELYHLDKDVSEANDLAAEMKSTLARL
jgi:hypothetical protein